MDCGSVTTSSIDSVFQEKQEISQEVLSKEQRNALLKIIFKEHSYAHPYQSLFQIKDGNLNKSNCITSPFSVLKVASTIWNDKPSNEEEEIDVENDYYSSATPTVRYDVIKAKCLMDEVDEYLNSLWKDINKDEDKKIVRSCTCREQTELFDSIYKTINNYQLAKLTYEKHVNEPVLRRLALDKATKRVHKAFSYVFWNSKHIAWLHGVLLDGLGSSLFLCYLEILQSLKRKEPELIERTLLEDKTATEKERSAGLPNLSANLKKSWDPSVGLSTKLNIEKFASTPFLLMIPSGPNIAQQSSKRSRFWNNQLVNFAKPISINIPAYKTPEGYVVKLYLEHCISAIRTKISGCRHCFPERLIVLVGWGVGSLIALKVALLDKVDAVICLGFPGKQVHNKESEEYWDSYSKVECPVLFFVGAHGTLSSLTETEKLRKSIKSETSLVIVESGDDMLRLSKGLKMKLGLTQNMIDKLIQDELYLFIKKLSVSSLKSHHIKEHFNPKKKKRKFKAVSKEEIKIIRKRILQKSNALQPLKLAQIPSSKPPTDLTCSSNDKQNRSAGLLTTANLYLTSTTSEETTKPAFTMSDHPVQSSPNQLSSTKIQNKKNLKEKNRKVKNVFKTSLHLQPSGEKKHCPNSSYLVDDVCNTTPNVHHGQTGLLASSSAGQIQVQGGSFYYLPQNHASLCSKNAHLSSANVFPNLKSQLVSSCSGKQTIVVHPTSRFVINQPTISNISTLSSSSTQLAETKNNPENATTQLNLNNISSSNMKKHLSSNAASDCEVQNSLLATPQSNPSIPTTSFVTDLSQNDLRYLASLILKQTTQSSSSNNSPNFMTTTTKFSAFASASANTSSSMFVGVKYLPSSSLSKSQCTPKSIVSSNVSTCIVSTSEKLSVFTNVQDNSSHTLSVSQCISKVRPTGVLRKTRVKTPYMFTGVCGNGTNGNFTLTYNSPYQNTKPAAFLNSTKISSSQPTSSSVTSAYFSQPKSESSVLTRATKSIVSSANLNFSNISEPISSTSKPITHPISTHSTGGALQDKEKKQFTNTILKNIFEHKLLEAKSDILSEKQTGLDKQYLSEKPVKVEDEQRTVDEQKRMYSVLQNFLKQTSQSCAEITRTDKLNILNVAAANGTNENVTLHNST